MAGILSGLRGLGRNSQQQGYNPLASSAPLRVDNQPDDKDEDRIARFLRDYNRQTDALLIADRQIEYNLRMLCGQQWNFWNWEAGQYMDVADWFTPEEQRWRQLPTVNDELRWYVNTHGRLTENPPILTWVPGPDKIDADLAEVLDVLQKLDWRRSNMATLHPAIMMWVVAAGRGHCVSRLDLTKGDWRPWLASARLPYVNADGSPLLDPTTGEPHMTSEPVDHVPIGPDYQPRAVVTPDGQMRPTGAPHMERSGGIAVDVISPLQVRAQWGPQLWHQKRWHAIQRFLTPEEVYETWGVDVEPDVNAEGAANVAILERVMYGAGFYGTSRGVTGGAGYPGGDVKGPLCTVIERWDAPLAYDPRLAGTWCEPMIETPENPGGRHIVLTPKAVIQDGPREVRWPYVSPVRCWDFIQLAGRPRGLTSLESLHSPQRFQNKMTQILQDGATLNGTPQRVIWENRGILADEVDNAPNRVYTAKGDPADGAPIAFLTPPAMNGDVFKVLELSSGNLERLGGLKGTQGGPPTDDPSGELIKELRFNADRDLGDTARRGADEYARLGEDWKALYPLIYTMKQIIVATGAENASKTISVYPELFKEGNARAQADAESMLPEGRGERQARAYRLWKDGAFGDPRDPEQWADATESYLEQARFPNYNKMSRPGGVDRVMAEEENGMFLMGAPGAPVLDWYNNEVHLKVHEKYMKSPEFLKQPQPVQLAFAFHRMQHIMKLEEQMANAAAAQQRLAPAPPAPGPGGGPPAGPDQNGKTAADSAPAGPANGPAALPASRGGAQGRSPLAPSGPALPE